MAALGVGGHFWRGVPKRDDLYVCSVCGAQRESLPLPEAPSDQRFVTADEALAELTRSSEITKLRAAMRVKPADPGRGDLRARVRALVAESGAWTKEVSKRKREQRDALKAARADAPRFRFRELPNRPWRADVPTCSRRRGELALVASQRNYIAEVAGAGSVSVAAWAFYLAYGRFPHQGEITAAGAVQSDGKSSAAPQATLPGVG